LAENRLHTATSDRVEGLAVRACDAREHFLFDALRRWWPGAASDRSTSAFPELVAQDASPRPLDAKVSCQLAQWNGFSHGTFYDIGPAVPFPHPLLVAAALVA
jgi:hypothetical protein